MRRATVTRVRTAFFALGILGLAGCATTPRVSTKVAPDVRLEQYKTYTFQTTDLTGLDIALEGDVRDQLERRGLKRVDKNPDLAFNYSAARRLEHEGEEGWSYEEGAILLVAKDATGRTVWSAHLQTVIDPKDKTYRHLKDAIRRAFKKYPSVHS